MNKKFIILLGLGAIVTSSMGYAEDADHHRANSNTVNVSANANGHFGVGSSGSDLPLVKALKVNNERTITIQYQSGTWYVGAGLYPGPNGIDFELGQSYSSPLQEVLGVFGGTLTNFGALIGAFVPDSLVQRRDFQALDGTKLTSGVGIMPNLLFFVGSYNVIQVSGPGTLYLGINDSGVADNTGSLTVRVEASK